LQGSNKIRIQSLDIAINMNTYLTLVFLDCLGEQYFANKYVRKKVNEYFSREGDMFL
jgi:hypothetical protein